MRENPSIISFKNPGKLRNNLIDRKKKGKFLQKCQKEKSFKIVTLTI